MSLTGQPQGETFFRIAEAIADLSLVPELGAVVRIIKELSGLVQRVKLIGPACEGLLGNVITITNALAEHDRAHPGNSRLEGAKNDLTRIAGSIKIDFSRWAKWSRPMTWFRVEEILAQIESHRADLQGAITHLMLKAALNQDVESAKRDRDMRRLGANMEEILKLVEEGARATAAIKQAYQTARLQRSDIDIEKTEDQILQLRFNQDPFTSEDMWGEVEKEGPEVFCSGGTFDVFRAKLVDRGYVAARRFRGRKWALSEKEKRRFKRLVNIWRALDHANILPLFGICKFEKDRPPYLISPWMEYGNVNDYLEVFPNADKLKLIHEVALGLECLHGVAILHGNLNGANVLVGINHQVRLTGFSLSKEIQEDTKRTNSNNATEFLRWWSPEALRNQQLSEQSDIWSFGMTALEILSGARPYKDTNCPLQIRDDILSDNLLPEPEDYDEDTATENIWTLMEGCWRPYGSRLDIERIVLVLREERIENGWDPDAPPPEHEQDPKFSVSF